MIGFERRLARVSSVIVLLGGLFPFAADVRSAQDVSRRPRQGPVRADGRAVADSGGAFNALGATLFWGAWGYKFDRARVERNLAVLRDAGVDYVRVLGSVGGPSWGDRETDPRWKDYEATIAGFTDLVYDRYGMRVQWTIFGGAPFTPAGPERDELVDRFARLARGREHKIFAFEIANEARSNGFGGPEGISDLRRLGARLNEQTTVLVALSDPASGGACALYAGAAADVATVHYERGFGREGPWQPIRGPWSYPGTHDRDCPGRLPQLVFNNEPIGPESSVRQDDDPGRIAAAYTLTFLANHAAYVFHAGPGIRGGGAADVSGKLRRHAHFDELPAFPSIVKALKAAKQYLPPGIANWTRHEPQSAGAPIQGAGGIYAASSGSAFVALVTEVANATVVRARERGAIEIRKISTGEVVQRVTVAAGKELTLRGDSAFVLIGKR